MILLFLENFFISLSAVFANKTRSILTALGIIIGVVSVTMMGTLISGLDKTFESSMSWLGKDILYVSRYEWFGDMEWWEVRNRPRIRPEYVDKVKERSKYALAVAPVMQRGASLSLGEKETRTEIFGTNEDYMETITTNIVQGRFFSKNEDRSGARVTVIGDGIKEAFFGDNDPIGKYIKIDNIKFRVIGVLEKQGKFLGLFSVDKQAILPIGAYNRIFSKRGWMRLSIKIPENKIEEGFSSSEIRPKVVPGEYTARVNYEGLKLEEKITVVGDNRIKMPVDDYRKKLKALLTLRDLLSRTHKLIDKVSFSADQLEDLIKKLNDASSQDSKDAMKIHKKILEHKFEFLMRPPPSMTYRQKPRLREEIRSLMSAIDNTTNPPTAPQIERIASLIKEVDEQEETILSNESELLNLNRKLSSLPQIIY